MPDKALGRLYAPDERDKNFPVALAGVVEPPKLPLWHYWVPGGILDQNGFPYCVAYAWKQYLTTGPVRQGKNIDTTLIYSQAQLIDEWPGEDYAGTSVRAGAKILQDRGYIKNYLWAATLDDIKKWILLTGPVVVGTNWYESMSKGIWNKFSQLYGYWIRPEGAIEGGHAWMLSGYSTQRRAFRAVNSWGRLWGDKGKCWIAEEHLQQLLNENGEACVASEVKLIPEPL